MRGVQLQSVRTYMVGLTLAVVLPLLAFGGFLVIRTAERQQTLMVSRVRERAQVAATAIDEMLAAARTRLFAMSTAPSLQSGDFATFHVLVSDILQRQGITVVLTDMNGHTVLSTDVPYGTPLPDFPPEAGLRQVADTGLSGISGFVANPLSHGPSVLVSTPTTVGGQTVRILSLDIMRALAQVLLQQHFPNDWLATVVDRNGYIIARSQNADRFVGRVGRLDTIARVQASNEGWFPYVSLDGAPMENAFIHIGTSGWTVIIGIPRDVLLEPVRQSTLVFILLGVGTLAVALLLAVVIGRRVSRPIARLVGMARVVGSGGRVPFIPTGLREADTVARSLYEASEQLVRNAVERERATTALRESGEQYRSLAEELGRANRERQTLLQLTVQGQEDERRRIARELHDGFGQYLTALRLGLTAMERNCAPGSEAPRQLAALKDLAGELGQALGRMAWEIRPTALDDLGLSKAIAQYLEEWAERSDLRIDQEIRLGGERLPPPIETTLFRVVQEAVTNVVKHSGADHLAVILDADGEEVRLIIEDNGRGFQPGECGGPGSRQLGLLGIRERLALVRGTLDIESLRGQGTTLYVCVPLAAAAA